MNSNNNNSIKDEANVMSMVKPPVSTTTTKTTFGSPSPRDVSISSGSENSAFSRIEAASSTPKILTHGKFTAFMNWIPMDRDTDYMRSVFKSLMISNNADIVMKEANVTTSSPFAKAKPPHYIAYITIPRNSILDTPQGIMFKDGILSNKYQIVLDCGKEYPKTEWEYRVYPTKSKLVPTRASPATAAAASDTVLPQKLPQLGVIRISSNEATYEKHVRDYTHSTPLSRVDTDRTTTTTTVAAEELTKQNYNYSDNLSDVSCSDESHVEEEVNETERNIILSLEEVEDAAAPSGLPPRSKEITYAGVVGTTTSSTNDPSKVPKRRPMWADISDDTPITYGEVRDNIENAPMKRNLPPSTNKASNGKGIDKDMLKSSINEMYDKTLSTVSSKHAACKLAYSNLIEANNGLREAKEELERYRSMMHLIGGGSTASSSNPHDDLFPEIAAPPQDEELEQHNNIPDYQGNYAPNDNGNVGGEDIPFIVDSNSGHVTPVTPILYYHANMDGTLSPVGPAQPANWLQYNQGNNFGQSDYYNGNNLHAIPNPTCNPSTPSPHTPVMTPSNRTTTSSRKSINVNMNDKVKCPPSAGNGNSVEGNDAKSQDREISIIEEDKETKESNIEVSKIEEEAELQTEAKDENSNTKNSSLKNMLKDLLIDDNIDNVSSDQLMAMLHKYKKQE